MLRLTGTVTQQKGVGEGLSHRQTPAKKSVPPPEAGSQWKSTGWGSLNGCDSGSPSSRRPPGRLDYADADDGPLLPCRSRTLPGRRCGRDTSAVRASSSSVSWPSRGALVRAKRLASSRSSFSVTACSMTAARSPFDPREPIRVESARPRGRVQGEPVERRARWLVVGERMRLKGREATHPLRPGRRRLTRNRRRGEVPFGVALPARLGLILVDPEQPAPAKVPLHAPDHALEHLPHLAGPEVPEPLPGEFAALLALGAIEDEPAARRARSLEPAGPRGAALHPQLSPSPGAPPKS